MLKKIRQDTTFIATVYNEEDSIMPFLKSISSQSLFPSQIVIVDGGSTDRTYSILKEYFSRFCPGVEVNIVQKAGAGISKGRNTAISKAKGEIICISDGGCVLDRKWLETITAAAQRRAAVGGYSASWARSFLQRCLAAAVMPLPGQIKEEKFMPSSRNLCLYKRAWQDAGGYPEHMDYGEDMKFNFKLKECGYRIKFVSQAVVYWKLRASLSSIFRQFFRYAKGDAVGGMYPLRHMIRLGSGAFLAAVVALSFIHTPLFLLLLLPVGLAYCFKALGRVPVLFYKQGMAKKTAALLFMPFLLVFIDTAKLAGYAYGQWAKRRHAS